MDLFDVTLANLICKLIHLQNHCIYYHRLYSVVDREKAFIELITNYLKIQNKLIPQKRYKVFFSEEIKEQMSELDTTKINAINAIKTAFENGESVVEWQSKTVFNSESDSMLNSWGLYHFHLGMSQTKKNIQNNVKFRERTGRLLIAYIDNIANSVYFIAISDKHGKCEGPNNIEFARKRYMEILDNNWEHLLSPFKVSHLSPQNVTDDQRAFLFKNNVNLVEEVNGMVIAPHSFGQMVNGTRILDYLWIRLCLNFLKSISNSQKMCSYCLNNLSFLTFLVLTNNKNVGLYGIHR